VHVLVTTDSSECSLSAISLSMKVLEPSTVTILTVADEVPPSHQRAGGSDDKMLWGNSHDEIETHLGVAADLVTATEVELVHETGDPGKAIVAAAARLNPDIVVVGCHGRGVISRAVLGSVSEYVVRHCTSSVLVMRSH
jgi:nucleotide-binding universal stress UspA family protein